MRTLSLARVAAAAELLRFRRRLRRNARRFGLLALAAGFVVAALATAHVAVVLALQPMLTPLQATLALLAADLLVAFTFAALAARDRPDPVEREAAAIAATARRALTDDNRVLRTILAVLAFLRRL